MVEVGRRGQCEEHLACVEGVGECADEDVAETDVDDDDERERVTRGETWWRR